jgi:prepilin-type N-terminal cleavage/methylation domain-containing protein
MTIQCRSRAGRRAEAGFTLIEMLVATAIMVVVTAGIFSIINPAQGTYQAQPMVSDMQQRLRVAVDAIERDLIMAGAGTYSGDAQGALGSFFSPILPHSVGMLVPGDPDNPDPTAITIMYVPPTSAQTTLSTAMPNESAELKLNPQPGCPQDVTCPQLCGFKQGMRVLIFDTSGSYDVFTVTQVQCDALHLQHRDDKFTTEYAAGAYITQMETHTYYLNVAERRLYHYDGYQTNLPIVDNVVGLRFEYFGEAAPAMLRKPVSEPDGPWTTYGPKPPALATDYASDDYAAGENCAFQIIGGNHSPRMADWSAGAAGGPLVPISYAELSNGPWCPGMTNDKGDELPNRFDVDMLRVRKVRVTVRVQVGDDAMRGANPPGETLFVNPGTAADGARYIRDQEIRFEVTPRNLNIAR